MQKRRLGASDLEITPIGVGAWAMGGGDWQFAWGAQDDNESVDAIHRALEKASIGSTRQRSTVWGTPKRWWRGRCRGGQKKPLVFTKCGIVWNEKRENRRTIEPESIRKEVEQSLAG